MPEEVRTLLEYANERLVVACGEKKGNMYTMDCNRAQLLLFALYKELKAVGVDIKLPHFWADRPQIDLNELLKQNPGMKWTCTKEDYENCGELVKQFCDFDGRYGGVPDSVRKPTDVTELINSRVNPEITKVTVKQVCFHCSGELEPTSDDDILKCKKCGAEVYGLIAGMCPNCYHTAKKEKGTVSKCPKCGEQAKTVSVPPSIYEPDGRIQKCTKCDWNNMW